MLNFQFCSLRRFTSSMTKQLIIIIIIVVIIINESYTVRILSLPVANKVFFLLILPWEALFPQLTEPGTAVFKAFAPLAVSAFLLALFQTQPRQEVVFGSISSVLKFVCTAGCVVRDLEINHGGVVPR